MKEAYENRMAEYRDVETKISAEEMDSIKTDRIHIRPEIEKEYVQSKGEVQFRHEAEKVDKKLKCGMKDMIPGEKADMDSPNMGDLRCWKLS